MIEIKLGTPRPPKPSPSVVRNGQQSYAGQSLVHTALWPLKPSWGNYQSITAVIYWARKFWSLFSAADLAVCCCLWCSCWRWWWLVCIYAHTCKPNSSILSFAIPLARHVQTLTRCMQVSQARTWYLHGCVWSMHWHVPRSYVWHHCQQALHETLVCADHEPTLQSWVLKSPFFVVETCTYHHSSNDAVEWDCKSTMPLIWYMHPYPPYITCSLTTSPQYAMHFGLSLSSTRSSNLSLVIQKSMYVDVQSCGVLSWNLVAPAVPPHPSTSVLTETASLTFWLSWLLLLLADHASGFPIDHDVQGNMDLHHMPWRSKTKCQQSSTAKISAYQWNPQPI